MKLTVVGCSGSFPSAESACSSYLVEADGFRLLLDMGNGALGELQRHCGLYDLDAVLLSHLHADHCIDMCGYFVARYYRHDGGATADDPGLRPGGHRARGWSPPTATLPDEKCMSEVFDFRTLVPGDVRDRPLHGRAPNGSATRSRRSASAWSTAARSSPTPATPARATALLDLAAGTDLFLCEASFTHGKEDVPELHLNGREAGEYAAGAGAARLVLTHIPPWTDPAVALRRRPPRVRRADRAGPHRSRLPGVTSGPA